MRVHFVHEGRESVGIEYLSAVLKQAGHEVGLSYDQGLFGPDDNVFHSPALARFFERRQRLLERVRDAGPDVVGFSVFTNNVAWALRHARAVKDALGVPVIFGGIHTTLVPDRIIAEPCVDYAVVGEAEEALVELLDALERGRDPAGLANVWTRTNGRAAEPPVRPPIADLDAIPFPDKTLFERTIDFRDDYLILTSRGCPYQCSYCCESFMNRLYCNHFFRRRSAENVLAELREAKRRYRIREVMFNDAIFFTDKRWLRRLLEGFREEIGVKYRCFGQVRFLDEEVADLLQRSGCYAIEFGVQTFNERIRREVLNRRETNADNERAFAICDDFGLAYDVDHMFGLPGESTPDHEQAARAYAGLRRLNRVKCHNLVFFPRLGITNYAVKHALLSDEDVEAIETGRVGDFFHQDSIRAEEDQREKQGFETLFKLLPILGRRGTAFFLRPGRRDWLRRMPRLLVKLLQVVGAVWKRDYRFFLYFRYYPHRLRRSLFG